MRASNLVQYMEDILKNSSLNNYPEFDHTIWLLFSGDKGGDSMKFVFSVVDDLKNGSVDNNHIFCMYSGSDSLEGFPPVY